MNSAPSSRYSTASEPITPINDSALAMGWVWITTVIPQTTAIRANTKNRKTSISEEPGHQKSGDEQIQDGDREKEFPGKRHELVVTKPGQRAAHPNEGEQQKSGFGRE